ncbi:ABC transporter ATP-binding protein [Microbacterium sp. BLY]|uniref:energy-coupling factor ABC transporter ATP-binding protein n=1 Tax=Microbacterium sp. BLY TaxID=2823280 RepID=UPI0027DDDE5F|nr:ABC transporter ATP-binding protein [Microbacterium sp. BLY]
MRRWLPAATAGATPRPAESRTLRLETVQVAVDDRVLLEDVSLDLDARRIAVIGANGSGKSTFARLLNGLMTPTSGTVTVHGLDVARDRAQVRRRVGFVFTDPDAQILLPTPAEDLALSLRGRPRDEVAVLVRETLERHGLGAHADVPATGLSGGQKQMLALAGVLLAEPALIVADEPTTLLDLRNARRIGDLLLAQEAQVLIVTHDLELAARCDVAILFDGGRVVGQGEPRRVVARYREMCA